MIQFLFFKIVYILMGQAKACPLCMGDDPNAKYFTYVILGFISFATIVIIYLLKTCLKYRNINNKELEK